MRIREPVFQILTDTSAKALDCIKEIYEDSFPSNERLDIALIAERIQKGESRLIYGSIGSETVCFSILWYFNGMEFCLLDYLAVERNHRGEGLGSLLFKKTTAAEAEQGRSILIEVEHPDFGSNRHEREDRIRFYEKNGAYLLEGFTYILPALDGSIPTEMKLMVVPVKPEISIESAELKRLLQQLYTVHYSRDENDTMLQEMYTRIPKKPIFTKNQQDNEH